MNTRPHLSTEHGSTTVLVVFLLPIMVIMMLLLANVGQAVFEKLRLQNTADAAALSAASVQAAGLNEIADLNFAWELEYFKMLRIILPPTFWDSYNDGNSCYNYFKDVFKEINKYQDDANEEYAEDALEIAEKVVEANLPSASIESVNPEDDKLMEYSDGDEMTVFFLYRICMCCSCGVGCACSCCPTWPTVMWNDSTAGSKKFDLPHDGRLPKPNTGILLPGFPGTVKVKIRKEDSPTTYSAFKVTQPEKDFIFAGSLFGKLEELTAYAAAKPTGGDIYNMEPNYFPIMTRLADLEPRPDVDDLEKFEH